MRGRALSLGLALALAMLALRGLAQDSGVPVAQAVKIEPGKCIDHTLADRVRTWLKRDTIDPRIRVQVKASKTANDVHFTIFRNDQVVGEKDMRAEMACPEFQSAVALAIASALDAIILEAEREADAAPDAIEEPIPDAGPEIVAPPIPDAGPPDVAPPPPSQDLGRLFVGLESGLSATQLPLPTALFKPSLEVRIVPWLDGRIALGFTPEISSPFANGRLVTQLVAVEMGACGVFLQRPVRARACLGIAIGAVPAHGSGFLRRVDEVGRWGAIPVRLDVRWPVQGVIGVVGSASVEPVLVPPIFAVDTAETQLPWVGFSLLGGVQVRVF